MKFYTAIDNMCSSGATGNRFHPSLQVSGPTQQWKMVPVPYLGLLKLIN